MIRKLKFFYLKVFIYKKCHNDPAYDFGVEACFIYPVEEWNIIFY